MKHRRGTPRSRREFWARDDVRLAGAAILLATFGLQILAALAWGALMLWQRDFRRKFTMWFKCWVLTGLVAVIFLEYPVSGFINVPPSWVAIVLSAGATWIGIRYQPKLKSYQWR